MSTARVPPKAPLAPPARVKSPLEKFKEYVAFEANTVRLGTSCTSPFSTYAGTGPLLSRSPAQQQFLAYYCMVLFFNGTIPIIMKAFPMTPEEAKGVQKKIADKRKMMWKELRGLHGTERRTPKGVTPLVSFCRPPFASSKDHLATADWKEGERAFHEQVDAAADLDLRAVRAGSFASFYFSTSSLFRKWGPQLHWRFPKSTRRQSTRYSTRIRLVFD